MGDARKDAHALSREFIAPGVDEIHEIFHRESLCFALPGHVPQPQRKGLTTSIVTGAATAMTACRQQSAWKTLAIVNSHSFAPGDSLFLKRGTVCAGMLWPKGSGA